MQIVMGYHQLPSLRDYWSTDPDLAVPFIANIMPRKRFEELRAYVHFNNNLTFCMSRLIELILTILSSLFEDPTSFFIPVESNFLESPKIPTSFLYPLELAKYFACSSSAYAYPLFKAHKLQLDHLLNAQITDILVRLLQSTGHIPTSRFTAIIEYILHPIAMKYRQDGINEYCRDSTHFLLKLDQWKSNNLGIQNKLINEYLFIVADVIALYPNINRNTLRDALTLALNL